MNVRYLAISLDSLLQTGNMEKRNVAQTAPTRGHIARILPDLTRTLQSMYPDTREGKDHGSNGIHRNKLNSDASFGYTCTCTWHPPLTEYLISTSLICHPHYTMRQAHSCCMLYLYACQHLRWPRNLTKLLIVPNQRHDTPF